MKLPGLYKIAFSSNGADRWMRHLLFWIMVYLYQVLRVGIMFPMEKIISKPESVLELALLQECLNLIFAYSVVYYLVPRFFNRGKYVLFAIGILLAFVAIEFVVVGHRLLEINSTASSVVGLNQPNFRMLRPGFIRAFGNPPLICCLLWSLKTLKNWHLEQLKTATLARENANAELQLLKAQVHPHFLFNTLNNIYSFALSKSPQAGTLVQKLSGMLGYMIHECEQTTVPLEKEIKLIRDYIGLEKVRYGDRLEMEMVVEGNYENQFIAPLLMIPFVENSFKHGASKMMGSQWIRIFITIENDELHFRLSNSKPTQTTIPTNKNGIGLLNVKKRLQLLYPEKYLLDIVSTDDTYQVDLKLTLQPGVISEKTLQTTLLNNPAYA